MKGNKAEAVTDRRSFLYGLLRVLAMIVFHTVMPVRFVHRERLDREAPYLLIANHRHALDPIIMAMGIRRQQIVFLAKAELGKNPIMKYLLTRVHCILVDRHRADMEAMRACMKAVRMKKILLIFPEGTRHHEGQMEQIESGTSMIAMRSRVPIVPIYIDRKLSFFRKTTLYVGEPIPYDDLLEQGINAVTCEALNERFRETYREMIRRTAAGNPASGSK